MNQPKNNIGSSPPEVEILGNASNEKDTVRTEKRILWNSDEDIRLMSAWI
jgi:hypothetical protein